MTGIETFYLIGCSAGISALIGVFLIIFFLNDKGIFR